MFPMAGVPPTIANGMKNYREVFCRDAGYEHVSRYVSGLVLSENKTLQAIHAQQVWPEGKEVTRRAMHAAVFEAGWSSEELMVKHRTEVSVDHQGGRGREVIAVDWTQAHHERGPHIHGVKEAFDYVERRNSLFQTVVTGTISNRELIDGLAVEVQVPNFSEEELEYLGMTKQEGSVAKIVWRRKKPGFDFSLGGSLEKALHKSHLSLNVTFTYSFNLPLSEHVDDLIATDRSPCCIEARKSESRTDSAFYESVILLNYIVEIFTLSQLSVVGEDSFPLQFFNRRWVGFVLIEVDNSRRLMFESLEHFAEESFGRLRVSLRAEHEIDRLASRIDRAVKIFPHAFHFDIGFIDAVGVVDGSQVRANPFLQFRSIPLNPPIDRRMID